MESAKTQPQDKPTASVFSLKTPYLKKGRITKLVSETENMWIHAKINAEGGENALHTHTTEDHAFIVLEGEVTFYDENNNGTVLKPYQGITIPKGVYYRYLNTGPGNLMVVRIGAGVKPAQGTRIAPDGSTLLGHSSENKHVDPEPIPGKFFGE